jgi:hypothetical protein
MALAPENKQKLLEATRESAIALAEDIVHLRQFAAKMDPTVPELRRLSSILRRLLVERDLSLVAAPRIGKILLSAPDNKPYYKADAGYMFFTSGGADAFGAQFRSLRIRKGAHDPADREPTPDKMIELSLDGFLSQRVLCLNGQWASRNSVIKYVANVTSGVHSKTPTKDDEKLLSRLRCVVSYEPTVPPTISLNFDAITQESVEFAYSANKLDPVLLELLVTLQLVVASPGVHALEAAIASEQALRR